MIRLLETDLSYISYLVSEYCGGSRVNQHPYYGLPPTHKEPSQGCLKLVVLN